MLFVGSGFLLSQAVSDALEAGHFIEYVFCRPLDSSISKIKKFGVPIIETNNINKDLLYFVKNTYNGTIFSINNPEIISDELLSSGSIFFNIHNGLVQKYRGLAEVCIFAAICNGEREYGATLHKLLPGQKVDTGPVISQQSFQISHDTDFAQLMGQSLACCQDIFRVNLSSIIESRYQEVIPNFTGKAMSYKDIPRLVETAPPEHLYRARRLGAYRHFFPKLAQALSL